MDDTPRTRRARAKPVRYTEDNVPDEEMKEEEETPKPRSRKRKIQADDFDPDAEPPKKKRATKATKKNAEEEQQAEKPASTEDLRPDQVTPQSEGASTEKSSGKQPAKKKSTPKKTKKAESEDGDETPKPKKPRAKKTEGSSPATTTTKKSKSKQKSALLNSSVQDQESDLLSKYASYSLQELQGMLPRDQYMKIAIQRMLIESPHQVNASNMIVNKELVPIRKSKPTYEEEIKSMMHSWGEVAQPNVETVKLLEAEATKFVQNLLQKLSHEAHKDKSHGDADEESEDSTAKEGSISVRKIGVKLDHFARALFPDMKSIRLVEHFLSFLKTSKAFAQHMDDTGADIEAYWAENDKPDENENKKATKEAKQQAMEIEETNNERAKHRNGEDNTEDNDAVIRPDWIAPSIDQLKSMTNGVDVDHSIQDCSTEQIKEEKLSRLAEREEFSRNMTQAQYIFFENCCKVSFGRPRKKFTEWLKSSCDFQNYNISMQKDVVDALAYLVYNRLENIVRAVKKIQSNSRVAIEPKTLTDYFKDKKM
jgi:hypothetical protein